ncbi:MAG: TrfB-related DNA-binding protein [Betaproteobacteria bacterium]
MKLKRLDAIEFDRLAALTQLGEAARTMARMVLVEGRPMTRVGALHNTSRQRVSHAVEAIRRVYKDQAIDRGWVSLDLPLPEALSVHLDQFARAFRAAPAGRVREKALTQVVAAVEQATAALRGQ